MTDFYELCFRIFEVHQKKELEKKYKYILKNDILKIIPET